MSSERTRAPGKTPGSEGNLWVKGNRWSAVSTVGPRCRGRSQWAVAGHRERVILSDPY
jgi:hypothetical protein